MDSVYKMADSDVSASRRLQLYALLGDLPDRHLPITVTLIDQSERDSYVVETLVLSLNGVESVPAYLVKPLHTPPPYPVILYNHAHGNDYRLGKDELLTGRGGIQPIPYAQALTAHGFAALCIDHWCFGERRGRTESEVFKSMLWRGQVLWGMMLYDSLRAVDYLVSRPDMNSQRIGTLGLSMGSTMAWWLAALDPRIKVCIDLCCLTDFDALIDTRGLDGHGIYYYVPSLLNHFSAAQINALIAPRFHASYAGLFDPLTPPAGLDRIDAALTRVYAEAGAPAHWRLFRSTSGHFETAAMRALILQDLQDHL